LPQQRIRRPNLAELIAGYEEKFNNPYFAASLGAIEGIIFPL